MWSQDSLAATHSVAYLTALAEEIRATHIAEERPTSWHIWNREWPV